MNELTQEGLIGLCLILSLFSTIMIFYLCNQFDKLKNRNSPNLPPEN